jgi:hypothetical protein
MQIFGYSRFWDQNYTVLLKYLERLGVTASNFDYEWEVQGVPSIVNECPYGNGKGTGTKFKGDVGFNYYFTNFKVSTCLPQVISLM